MALYAIGDVQGCYDSLQRLLGAVRFDPKRDQLWFTGDLVNRGPQSAEVVRYVASLGERAVTVLGNHELHLLAVAAGSMSALQQDTFDDILRAKDSEHLLSWISNLRLAYYDPRVGFALVHAGLLPQWSITDAISLAAEVEAIIHGPESVRFFDHMYGDLPDRWSDSLTGSDRRRLIVNGLTRIRFCYPDGRMDYRCNGPPGSQNDPLLPWFQLPERRSRDVRIVFGHWSLLGLWQGDGVIGLDTGCLWGRRLTAVRLDGDTPQFTSVPCRAYRD
jgi:bis(5'-nucleosyl)-tetraphosphatase (symmetrical)